MKAFVTGAGGFLGAEIVAQLVERGDEVVALARRPVAHLQRTGVEMVIGSLEDRVGLTQAAQGCDAIIHVAAKAGFWGGWRDYYEPNVLGTRNVLEAARMAGIGRFVYTSSPSVTFDGRDSCGHDESLAYPETFLNAYSETKAQAEREVLAANGRHGLLTVALRPHLIWGPGDPHIIPRLIERARTGKLVQIGDGSNRVDITYITNAAWAHLLALDRLQEGSPVCGRAYFISQGEPVLLWPWIASLLARLNLAEPRRKLPLGVARALGAVLEFVYRLLDLKGEPRMTRFLAAQLGTSHYYNIAAARRDLGYEARVGTAEGLELLLQSLTA